MAISPGDVAGITGAETAALPPSLLNEPAHGSPTSFGTPGLGESAAPSAIRRSAPQGATRIFFGAAPVDSVTMEQASLWLLAALAGPRGMPHLIMGPNAFLVTLAQRNVRFGQALTQASICLPDGMSVVWGSRLLGNPIRERVPGGEFMERMCALAAANGRSVYLLGGLPGAANLAAKNLCGRYPGLRIAGTDCPEPGFERDQAANQAVLDRIRVAAPDLLCVALGAPKQEIWMLENCGTLPIGAALSVGAALDTQAGMRKRAPKWTHAIGAEWLYRLVMEPRRLWRRYLIGNAQFGVIVLKEWIRLRKAQATERLLQPEQNHAPHLSTKHRRAKAGLTHASVHPIDPGRRDQPHLVRTDP